MGGFSDTLIQRLRARMGGQDKAPMSEEINFPFKDLPDVKMSTSMPLDRLLELLKPQEPQAPPQLQLSPQLPPGLQPQAQPQPEAPPPELPAVKAYREYHEKYYPKAEEQPKPSKKRKLGAILGGIAAAIPTLGVGSMAVGQQVHRDILEAPYMAKLRQFQMGAEPYKERAEEATGAGAKYAEAFERTQRGLAEAERGPVEAARAGLYRHQQEPGYERSRFGYKPQSLQELEDVTTLQHPVRPPTDTPKDRMARVVYNAKAAMKRLEETLRSREKVAGAKGKAPTPQSRLSAEKLVDEQIVREYPEYRGFYNEEWAAAGKYILKAGDPKEPTYAAFLARRKALVDEVLATAESDEWEEITIPEPISEESEPPEE